MFVAHNDKCFTADCLYSVALLKASYFYYWSGISAVLSALHRVVKYSDNLMEFRSPGTFHCVVYSVWYSSAAIVSLIHGDVEA